VDVYAYTSTHILSLCVWICMQDTLAWYGLCV